MSSPCKTAQERERQLRQACDVLERRVRAGESYRTEDCLAAHPELAADSDATLELLYFEYVLREELGEELSAQDWYCRFPEQQVSLEKILQIHHGVCDRSGPSGLAAALATLTPEQTLVQPKSPGVRRLGKYELLEELGRGSMGVVYKAREPALDRLVALKVVLAGPHAGPDQLVRVHREARAIARLQHPNIVQIHEIGEDDGRPFLCMEYVDGLGLDRLLARWNAQASLGLTPLAAAQLLESLAHAVHHAHQQGIIHRDLKPANILLASGGVVSGESKTPAAYASPLTTHYSPLTPKITDFGLAKFLDSSADATQGGHLVGTPSFMAPEQAGGRSNEAGPTVDVYALGGILYQLLTGRPPFQAPTVQETLELVRSAEPTPPRQLQPNLPRDLQTICLKCLAKEPSSRYASAQELAEDLRRFLAGEPIRARPATVTDRLGKWVKRRPVVAGLLTALFLAVVGGGMGIIWQWQRAEQNAADADRNARKFKQERDKAVEERGRAERHLKSARESIDELAKLGDQLYLQPQMTRTGKTLLEKVLAFYQEVLKDESTDPVVRLGTAQVCGHVAGIRHTLGQWDLAIEAFEQESTLLEGLLKEAPENVLYRQRLAQSVRRRANVLRDVGKTLQARAAYQEAASLGEQILATAPANPTYQAGLANTVFNMTTVFSQKEHAPEVQRLFQRAIDLIQSALKTNPQDAGWQSELALYLEGLGLFHWQAGQGAQAEATFRAGIEIQERLQKLGQLNRETQRYLGRAYSSLGMIVAGRGRFVEAEKIYDQAADLLGRLVKEYPDDMHRRYELVRTRTGQGALQEKLGKYHEAAKYYREAVQLHPDSATANNSLAWFLTTCPELSFRDAREAVRLAKKAVAADPQSRDCWNTLGVAHYRDGDYKAAVGTLEKAVTLRSGNEGYDWFFLAMARWKLGDRDEARRWLAKGVQWAQENEPKNEELHRFQEEAQALLNDSPTPIPPSQTPDQ
jgi:serine/threonine protein kinase/Flp pilus assembly protein TadD